MKLHSVQYSTAAGKARGSGRRLWGAGRVAASGSGEGGGAGRRRASWTACALEQLRPSQGRVETPNSRARSVRCAASTHHRRSRQGAMAASVHSAVAPLPICGSTANSATPTSPPAAQPAGRRNVGDCSSMQARAAAYASPHQQRSTWSQGKSSRVSRRRAAPVMLAVPPLRPSARLRALSAAAYSAHTLGAQ